MSSENKKSKVDKRHHWGRGRDFLKKSIKLKGVSFYNSCDRQSLKRELNKMIIEEEHDTNTET